MERRCKITVTPGVSDWNGASGLNWSVGAGTYWVAFEGQDFSGFAATKASSPLARYAFSDGSYLGYQAMSSNYAFGVQIDAVATVPEPASFGTLIAGLGLIGAVVGARKNQQI